MIETFNVTLEVIRYHNEATGWFVGVTAEKQVIVGVADFLSTEVPMRITGEWTENTRYGRQFKATEIYYRDTAAAVKALLGSGFLKYVKAHLAAAIVSKYGEETIGLLDEAVSEDNETCDEARRKLQLVKGIGSVIVHRIARSWKKQRPWAKAALLCIRAGLSLGQAKKCYKLFGLGVADVINKRPYGLTIIRGITWKKADEVAKMEWPGKVAIDHDDPMRYAAAVREILGRAYKSGHACYPMSDTLQEACRLAQPTDTGVFDFWLTIRPILETEGLAAYYGETDKYLYLASVLAVERATAEKLTKIADTQGRESIPWAAIEDELSVYTPFDLSEDQRQAVKMALEEKVCVITGGPGTGKTTTLLAILNVLAHKDFSFTLCAPTGKAAIRMTEATGFAAGTIHRTLGLGIGEDAVRQGFFTSDYVFVDEVSMCDVKLFYHVVDAMLDTSRLILIGDVDQLPPVGPGEPFYQIIHGGLPTTRLTFIHRQGKNSGIVWAASHINHGRVPETNAYDDFKLGYVGDNARLAPALILYLEKVLEKYSFPFADLQVLTPVNGHPWGQRQLNVALQEKYNPGPFPHPAIPFKVEDKVIHLVNNYKIHPEGVMNGEIGRVTRVVTPEVEKEDAYEFARWQHEVGNRFSPDTEQTSPAVIDVQYGNSKFVGYSREALSELGLAYALTIHKMQGSEARAGIVLVPITWEEFQTRQLLYTGITRFKEYCLVLSAQNAVERYAKNEKRVRRYTQLASIMAGGATS